MRLSDVVAHSSTSALFAQIALVVAILGFAGVLAYVFLRRNRKTFERARMMPLDDEQPQTPVAGPEEQRSAAETPSGRA